MITPAVPYSEVPRPPRNHKGAYQDLKNRLRNPKARPYAMIPDDYDCNCRPRHWLEDQEWQRWKRGREQLMEIARVNGIVH